VEVLCCICHAQISLLRQQQRSARISIFLPRFPEHGKDLMQQTARCNFQTANMSSVQSNLRGDSHVKLKVKSAGMALICAVLASAPISAFAYTGQELASEAKVGIDQARAIALKATPGKIATEELEKESGGSGLRYTFDIKRGTKTYEIGVDAQTGAVLENQVEGPNPD
jgi:uncharacterized membrane protein YkoI